MLTAAQAQSKERPRDQASRLYKKKKYDEACPFYEKLATDAKVDGALWADLGLCEFRRAHAEAGQRASLLAMHYGNEAVRKNAYFNLQASGYRADLPKQKSTDEISCEFLPAAPQGACDKKTWVCVVPWASYGTGGGTSGTTAVFGFGAAAMAVLRENPPFQRGEETEDSNVVPLTNMYEEFCGYCHGHAWDCSSSSVVTPKVEQCFKKNAGTKGKPDPDVCLRRTPADGKLCDAYMTCSEALCTQAQTAYESNRALWPKAADEIAQAHSWCNDCGIQRSRTCEVIAVDSCNGRIGYACQQEVRGKKGKLTVGELTLTSEDENP